MKIRQQMGVNAEIWIIMLSLMIIILMIGAVILSEVSLMNLV